MSKRHFGGKHLAWLRVLAIASSIAVVPAACSDDATTDRSDEEPVGSVRSALTVTGSVLTQHNDNSRTGLNPNETILTPATVNNEQFGKIYERNVDGPVYAQPLYVKNLTTVVDGGTSRTTNVVLVATMNNSIYAFDANVTTTSPTDGLLWKRTYGPLPLQADAAVNDNIQGSIGILGTPVVDGLNQALYFVTTHYTDPSRYFVIHKVSLTTATESASRTLNYTTLLPQLPNGPPFWPKWQLNRPGLLLADGKVFAAFGSNFDYKDCNAPYHGWIMGFDASLNFSGVYTTTRTPPVGGGIWQAGNGLASDGTNIFFVSGNAYVSQPDWCMNVQPGATSANEESSFGKVGITPDAGTLPVVGKFTPGNDILPYPMMPSKGYNPLIASTDTPLPLPAVNTRSIPGETYFQRMEKYDQDLGSGGVLLIPDPDGTRWVGGGKGGVLFVGKASTMTGGQSFQAFVRRACKSNCNPKDYGTPILGGPHIHGSPVFWQAPLATTGNIYAWSESDSLRRYIYNQSSHIVELDDTRTQFSRVKGFDTDMPGGILSISSNGNATGSVLVWAYVQEPENESLCPANDCNAESRPATAYPPGRLYAFDAENIARPLFSGNVDKYSKFVAPTVADGKVYVPTRDCTGTTCKFLVYGPRNMFATSSQITSLKAGTGKLDQFRLDVDGYVRNAPIGFGQVASAGWSRIGNSFNVFDPQKIAAASRNTSREDLFMRGKNGLIYTTGRPTGAAWEPWIPLPGSGNSAFVGDVTAVTGTDNITLFATKIEAGVNVNVYAATYNVSVANAWSGWTIVGNTGNWFPPQRVAALQTSSTAVDAFAVGGDHRIYWTRRNSGVWNAWSAIGLSNNTFPYQSLSGVVTANSTTPNIFAIGTAPDSRIWSAWYNGSIWQFFAIGTYTAGQQANTFPPQSVAAISRTTNHIDVFARGFNGRVLTAYWDAANGSAWVPPFALGNSLNVVPPDAMVEANSEHSLHVQFFVSGNDVRVWSSYWENTDPWHSWFLAGPVDQ